MSNRAAQTVPTTSSRLSVDTLRFLRELLNQVSITAADPGFETAAATIAKARRELDQALPPSADAK